MVQKVRPIPNKEEKKAAVNCREIQDALLRRNWVQLWEGSRYAPERKWEQKNIENERERERKRRKNGSVELVMRFFRFGEKCGMGFREPFTFGRCAAAETTP